ncbi:hypothetical protein BS47DRAFT_1363518 [Hydnum rufescens UP504]|uniref:Uncharacterized protein n=1 Tax=Hydnum rufescens UP504 TaxID=1448309 RepID=A0A9P6AUX1_9AGAM|nr:hypothetical protein BS47DRAFT_1363518 [Hydnum rufescens UP504]
MCHLRGAAGARPLVAMACGRAGRCGGCACGLVNGGENSPERYEWLMEKREQSRNGKSRQSDFETPLMEGMRYHGRREAHYNNEALCEEARACKGFMQRRSSRNGWKRIKVDTGA